MRPYLARPVVLLLAISGGGCGDAAPPRGPYAILGGDPRRSAEIADVEQPEWTRARARLGRLRGELPSRPYTERVELGVTDPRTGEHYEARGAVAVSPGRAARLVLLGPGGATALDLWVTRDRFRFAVPPMKLERRGGADPSDARGLPVGFLRWWLLAPLRGDLLFARSTRADAAFLLRDGRATVMLRTDGARFFALRREGTRAEALEWSARGIAPRAGARGRYVDAETGVRVHVVVEEVLAEEPDPAAFDDPDGPAAPEEARR